VLIIPDHAQGAAIGGGRWIARGDWNWGTLDERYARSLSVGLTRTHVPSLAAGWDRGFESGFLQR
jgi:hypothetical protein